MAAAAAAAVCHAANAFRKVPLEERRKERGRTKKKNPVTKKNTEISYCCSRAQVPGRHSLAWACRAAPHKACIVLGETDMRACSVQTLSLHTHPISHILLLSLWAQGAAAPETGWPDLLISPVSHTAPYRGSGWKIQLHFFRIHDYIFLPNPLI